MTLNLSPTLVIETMRPITKREICNIAMSFQRKLGDTALKGVSVSYKTYENFPDRLSFVIEGKNYSIYEGEDYKSAMDTAHKISMIIYNLRNK